MIYIAGIALEDGRVGCLMNDDQATLAGWNTEEDALAYFTNGYSSHSKRGYEGAMSALLNWLTLDFRVFPIDDSNLDKYFDVDNTSLVRSGNVSGSYLLAIMRPGHESLVESGTKPRPIS